MGEQGAESLHAHIHKLETNFSTLPNKLDRLKHIFNMYNLETAPTLLSLKPGGQRGGERTDLTHFVYYLCTIAKPLTMY